MDNKYVGGLPMAYHRPLTMSRAANSSVQKAGGVSKQDQRVVQKTVQVTVKTTTKTTVKKK